VISYQVIFWFQKFAFQIQLGPLLLGQLFGAQLVDLLGFPAASTCLAAALLAAAAGFTAVRSLAKPPPPPPLP
jgi:hypothetical protein